ncbi:DUF3857 domain-containing protein [Pedobacter insulae]|uniref:Transglutaminase-like enzyme, putative cysteine protease n=1 Tax=Pedobacter insulae TaxID=414048 RepID=A0A1I2WNM3_9SPHI|nr:DUF3857 domain-containing protein [Pedobacter insulae]SFH02875.1 Transglutaminase-like enzyme, putative cysteine protease [Pedobacter insulae]
MKHTILFFVYTLIRVVCYAQNDYNTELIPSSLLSRANATIRSEETVVDMRAADNVIYAVKQVITVLNKNGESNAGLVLFYDKSTIIKSVKGEIYNAFGKLHAKFSQNDFIDESAVQNFSLFEDNRIKRFSPSMNTYPYTVVYQYEVRFKQNLIIPTWYPKPADDVSVEKSTYSFICKPADKFRVKSKNLLQQPVESINEKEKRITWTVRNLPGIKSEPYSPHREMYEPFVKIAPEDFTYYNRQSNYTNWQELGKWIYDDLLKDRATLPATTLAVIQNLVKEEKTAQGKVRKIYQYLQDKTRYISVQIGIGGFRPISASEVDRLGYGDCKALVNYMQSLLKAADIVSYYCVVNAGDEKRSLDPSFASMNQANHVILCVPLAGDTTWLECTSQKIPYGFLSNFTDDRIVLACTPSGGKLLRTPKYTAQQNLQKRTANFVLNKNGNINGEVNTVFQGTQYDHHDHIVDKTPSEQEKFLKKVYPINNVNFDKITYTENKDKFPELLENLAMSVNGYGAINNNKLFLPINPFQMKIPIAEVRNRLMPLHLNRGYTDEDNFTYTLTEDLKPVLEPLNKSLQNQFGSYVATTTLKDNVLTYYRKFVLNEGTFTAASYVDFVTFINEVNTAEQQRCVLNLK